MRLYTPLLAVLAITAGCATPVANPHAGAAARTALATAGFDWSTREGDGFHLHYPRGSVVESRIDRLFEQATAAVHENEVTFGEPRSDGPIELFLVDSREHAVEISGTPYMGRAFPGELTALFVSGTEASPAFVHEIAHVLTLDRWGNGRAGTWMAEGVATWAAGDCLDEPLDSIAAGYLERGELPHLIDLEQNFWEIDELPAYFAAGSLVGFVANRDGVDAVEQLWSHDVWPSDDSQLESDWRAYLASQPAVTLDQDQLRRYGCEGPA